MSDILNTIIIGEKAFHDREKVAIFYFHDTIDRSRIPISKAFQMLNSDEECIEFCNNLINLWKDNDRKEEARNVFCKLGWISSDDFDKYHGSFHCMLTSTKRGSVRLWVYYGAERENLFMMIQINRYDDFDSSGLTRLLKFWESFKPLIFGDKFNQKYDGFKNGDWHLEVPHQ
jgi:hypothetical protein